MEVLFADASSSMAPRMLTVSEDEMVPQGGDIRLVCCAIGSPPPTYRYTCHITSKLPIYKIVPNTSIHIGKHRLKLFW